MAGDATSCTFTPRERQLPPERAAEEALGAVLVDREHPVPRGLDRAAHVERDPAPLVALGEEDDPRVAPSRDGNNMQLRRDRALHAADDRAARPQGAIVADLVGGELAGTVRITRARSREEASRDALRPPP